MPIASSSEACGEGLLTKSRSKFLHFPTATMNRALTLRSPLVSTGSRCILETFEIIRVQDRHF